MDRFAISPEMQNKLIIDLLVRVTVENSVLKQTLYGILSKGDENVYNQFCDEFTENYNKCCRGLRAEIFAEYGTIDLEDTLSTP